MKPKSSSKHVYIYGHHAVQAALKNPERKHSAIYCLGDLPKEMNAHSSLLRPITKQELDKMLPGAVHQGLVLATSPLPYGDIQDLPLKNDRCLLLAFDQLTDPHNVGAILRSAACFNVDGVIYTDRNSPTESGVLAKTASGALDFLPSASVVNLVRALEQLKKEGFWVLGLAEQGTHSLATLDLPQKLVVVIGAEGDGMRKLVQEHCDYLVSLPTNPNFPTLNASTAASVCLYAVRQKIPA
jgi:23S rRNA (guanosine2251-2'-O)-methyltransferase